MGIAEHFVSLNFLQGGRQRCLVEVHLGQFQHALGRIKDRTVAGAAAQVAGQGFIDGLAAYRFGLAFLLQVQAPQRHGEARRAKAALRTVAFHQRFLHRVQAAILLLQVFHGEHGLAVQRRDELDARVHVAHFQFAVDQRSYHHGAGATVAFRAAFLGAGAVVVFAQVLQQGPGRSDVAHFMDLALVVKPDRLRLLLGHFLGSSIVFCRSIANDDQPGK
jgi:hypothetical protein